MIKKAKIKELEENFKGQELYILIAYGNGEFDKKSIAEVMRDITDKNGGSPDSCYTRYKALNRYGAFEKYFPEMKPKKKYIQVSFRMSEDLHKQLSEKSFKTKKSLNKLITQAVKRSLR